MLDALQATFPESEMLEWNYDNDNFEVLSKADILISDYSGVVFDYSFIFNRPFIYTDAAFNPDPYEAFWLKEDPWLIQVLPLLGKKLDYLEFDNLKEVIDETISSEESAHNREKIRDEAWQYKGCAGKRTVDYMIQKYEELKENAGKTQ